MRHVSTLALLLLPFLLGGCTALEGTKLAPVAVIEALPQQGNAPFEVHLSAAASHDLYGKITSYAWDFGDGTTDSEMITTHTYTRLGTYVVTLSVTNSLGLSNTDRATLLVTQRPGPNPPTDLSANAQTSKLQIELSWSDHADNEEGFNIQRKASGGRYEQIDTTDADITTYNDRLNLAPETEYCYRVNAFNSDGDSRYTKPVCATTVAAPTGINDQAENDLVSVTRNVEFVGDEIRVEVVVTAKVDLELVAVVETPEGLTLANATDKLSAFATALKAGDDFVHMYTLKDDELSGGTISGTIRAKPADADSQTLQLVSTL